jgi:N-acetyl-gamma-glutamylphosphate reductase
MDASTGSSSLLSALRNHPYLNLKHGVGESLTFGTNRSISVQQPNQKDLPQVGGLPELMDNNPLVCAQHAWVPSSAGTLALIALGPVIEAGLVIENPAIILNFEASEEDILQALKTVHWNEEVTLQCENHDLGSVLGIYALVKINTPDSLDEIDEIYAERYSKSFFVRESTESEWSAELVQRQPFAAYRLEITEGHPHSILSIHVMGDVEGKLGAAQMIHMMNIMSGFEESIGISATH